MGLLFFTATVGMSQNRMNDRTAALPAFTTTADMLADETQKVNEFVAELKTADKARIKKIHREIDRCQKEILRLRTQLHDQAMIAEASYSPVENRTVARYDFDEYENSLVLDRLKVENDLGRSGFNLQFSCKEKGDADIKILTPGGEVAFHDQISNFDGDYKAFVKPSQKNYGIWFVHITVDDKATTKKLVFN